MKRNILLQTIKRWLNSKDHALADSTESALIELARSNAIKTPIHLKSSVLSKIQDLNDLRNSSKPLSLDDVPLINIHSHASDWNKLVKHISAPDHFDEIHLEPIRSDSEADIFVAFVKKSVPEETHQDLLESFLLLEGSCTCEITDSNLNRRTVYMEAGDYLAIGLYENHTIKVTSEKPAKAILQWLKLAA